MGVLFGAAGEGLKMIAKQTGKSLAKAITHVPDPPLVKLDIPPGATEQGIRTLLSRAHSLASLKTIHKFLHSEHNTIPYNKTAELVRKCIAKAGELRWKEHLTQAKNEFLKQIGDPLQMAHDLLERMM